MRSIAIRSAISAAFMACASLANAALIDLDFSGYSGSQSLTALGGVSFSLLGGPASAGKPSIAVTTGGGVLTNSADGWHYPTANILQFKFDQAVSNIKFLFDNEGASGGTGRGASFAQAFDAQGHLLETISIYGTGGLGSHALHADGVTTLQFNNGTAGADSWVFGVRSLTADAATPAVPEPASLALASVGLLVLARQSRRRGVK